MTAVAEYVINPNLQALFDWEDSGFVGGLLEGSSRSGKTWASVDNLVRICSENDGLTILIIKETYNSFKTTLFKDFNDRLPMYGIRSPFQDRKDVTQFNLLGNTVHLLGADSETVLHGVGSDYIYFNEMLDISQAAFDQLEMRCKRFWWGDYNPKATAHWIFDRVEKRKDVGFLKTTFEDNPYISDNEKRKILSYDPNNPINVEAGTADDYMWNVYGLGLRSAPEGLVFQHVTYIDAFPDQVERVFYGMDFGFSEDPTTLNKIGKLGMNLYIQNFFYAPTPSTKEITPALDRHLPPGAECIADRASPGTIGDLRNIRDANGQLKYPKILASITYPGAVNDGIAKLKKYKIHLVNSPAMKAEQTNYKYRVVRGVKQGDPEDKNNHIWDPVRNVAIYYRL